MTNYQYNHIKSMTLNHDELHLWFFCEHVSTRYLLLIFRVFHDETRTKKLRYRSYLCYFILLCMKWMKQWNVIWNVNWKRFMTEVIIYNYTSVGSLVIHSKLFEYICIYFDILFISLSNRPTFNRFVYFSRGSIHLSTFPRLFAIQIPVPPR